MSVKVEAARSRVLDVLRSYPSGIRSDRLARLADTPRSQARIGELRKMGYQISTTYESGTHLAVYSLAGKGEPQDTPAAAFHVRVYRTEKGWKYGVHPYAESGLSGLMEDVDRERLRSTIKKAISDHLQAVRVWSAEKPEAKPEPTPEPTPELAPDPALDWLEDWFGEGT